MQQGALHIKFWDFKFQVHVSHGHIALQHSLFRQTNQLNWMVEVAL